MMSCIFVLYLLSFSADWTRLAAHTVAPHVPEQTDAADPDALYAKRSDVGLAKQAAAIWQSRLQKNPNDFESAWKLARASYWIGTQAPATERRPALEQGITAGRAATRIEPNRPEGHMWLAADMGALAESFGLRQGIKYRGEIKNELLIVLRLDPGYEQGSADRALGRWYYKVPGLFGGSNQKSEEYLRRALTYNPNSTASLYFLAETLIAMKRKPEAKQILQHILDVPLTPGWEAEDRDFKARAQRLIGTLR